MLTFPAGAMVFFIPWRVVAEESGAAHFGSGGAMLLDLPGPALRLLTDVADFHFSDIPVHGDDGARAVGATDDDASPVRREPRGQLRHDPIGDSSLGVVCGVLSLRHFRLASWCSLSLSGWSPKNPARRISTCSGRLGGAAAADDVADFFLVIFRGATGSTAPTALIEAASTGVCGVLSLRHFRLASWCSLSLSGWSPKNPARRISTCSGRLGGAAAADDVADFFLVIFRGATGSTAPTALIEAALTGSALTALAAPTRAREAAPIPVSSDADRPARAGWAALRLLADVASSF